ncbi:ABC transporter substrate-binding protein [Egibacter rhizosphaerae]|nr:ABC transporter substrate-binding protein [Egibacter rhizosphaerae]
MRRELVVIVLMGATVGVLTACGDQGDPGGSGPDRTGADDQTEQHDEGGEVPDDETLVIAVGGEPDNLNPIFGDIFGSIYGDHWPMFSSLLSYDGDLELQPDLAARMPEVSADGTEVTVTLRDDVAFHDGEPFDADDVVFTYESILDEEVATGLREQLYDSLEAVEATGDHEVSFSLSRRDPAFLDKLTLGIVPEHLLADEDLNTAEFNLDPVGTGPFEMETFDGGERMVWTGYDDFHGGEVALERVVVSFLGDANARVSQLEAGAVDVDAAGQPPRVAERFDGDSEHEVVTIPGDQLALTIPTTNEQIDDPEVRRAIGMAIDRDALIDGVYAGAAREAEGPFAPDHWAHHPVDAGHDPEEAEAVLEAAGWTRDNEGARTRDGDQLSFPIVHGHGDEQTLDAILSIRDDLADVGVEVEPEEQPGRQELVERVADGAASLQTLGNAYDPELAIYREFHSEHADDDPGTNPGHVEDPHVDAALEAGRETGDRAQRAEAYADLAEALAEQGSWHFLAQLDNQLVVSDRVEGVDPARMEGHIHGWSRGLLWNLHEWRLEE